MTHERFVHEVVWTILHIPETDRPHCTLKTCFTNPMLRIGVVYIKAVVEQSRQVQSLYELRGVINDHIDKSIFTKPSFLRFTTPGAREAFTRWL